MVSSCWRIAGALLAYSLSFASPLGIYYTSVLLVQAVYLEYMQNSAGTKRDICGTGGVWYFILGVIARDNLSTAAELSHGRPFPKRRTGFRLFKDSQNPVFATRPSKLQSTTPSPPYELLSTYCTPVPHFFYRFTPSRGPVSTEFSHRICSFAGVLLGFYGFLYAAAEIGREIGRAHV